MKDRKVLWGVIVSAAIYMLLVGACGTSPANLPDEMLLTIRGIECVTDSMGGLSGTPRTGIITAPDGQPAFFFENGKNAERDGDDRWIIVVCDIRPGNYRGYTRVAVEIAADSADLLLDIERFMLRVRDMDLNWYDYHRNAQWNLLAEAARDDFDVTRTLEGETVGLVFRTLEWEIEDPNSMGVEFDYRRLFDMWLMFIAGPEDIPGRIYFRNLRFLK